MGQRTDHGKRRDQTTRRLDPIRTPIRSHAAVPPGVAGGASIGLVETRQGCWKTQACLGVYENGADRKIAEQHQEWVNTRHSEKAEKVIREILREQGMEILDLLVVRPSLEDVFVSIVQEKQRNNAKL